MRRHFDRFTAQLLRITSRPHQATWVIGTVILLPALLLLAQQDYALLLTIFTFGSFLIISTRSKLLAICVVFAFLSLLGDIRRITTLIVGPRTLDPLLMVGAVAVIYLAVPLLVNVRLTDRLSKAMLALMAVMTLEIVNPRQGPVAVGISGAFFSLIPMLWFWVGRRYGSDRAVFLLFYRVLVPIGTLAALLGIAQTFIGFFPWELSWAQSMGAGYALTHNGNIRAFGFSTSSAEYGNLLLITGVLAIGAVLAKHRVYLLVLPIVGTAMVLSAMRGPIVRTLFAGAMMWAIRGKDVRAWIPRLAFGLVLGLGLMSYSVSHAGGGADAPSGTRSTANVATTRVTQGLAHPFEEKYSTAGLHWQLFVGGITQGFTNPIGYGLGIATLGANKFGNGNDEAYSSEVDISDTFRATGCLGGLLYVFVIFLVVRETVAYVRTGPPVTRISAVGVLASLFGVWIALGQYGIAPIAWFAIGALASGGIPRESSADNGLVDSQKWEEAYAFEPAVL